MRGTRGSPTAGSWRPSRRRISGRGARRGGGADIRYGLGRFGESMRGFLSQEGTLYAVESRTSSPVRIDRENYESVTVKGLYPVGEGAGHAGGIVSSAVDGIRAALRILEIYSGQRTG